LSQAFCHWGGKISIQLSSDFFRPGLLDLDYDANIFILSCLINSDYMKRSHFCSRKLKALGPDTATFKVLLLETNVDCASFSISLPRCVIITHCALFHCIFLKCSCALALVFLKMAILSIHDRSDEAHAINAMQQSNFLIIMLRLFVQTSSN
jgi:hypothetical protein